MLTQLISNDHIDGGFGRLSGRIAMMLDYLPPQEVISDLLREGIDQTDLRLAYAAARIMRQDGWPTKI